MKKRIALFVHDGPLYKDRDGIYCSTNITEEMLSRFFSVADEICILIRVSSIDDTYAGAGLQKIDDPRIRVIELSNVVSVGGLLRKGRIKRIIEPVVEKSDFVFLRLPGITCNIVAEICKKQNKKYMVEVGGCAWDSYWNHGLLGKMVAPYMEMSQKKTVRGASFASYVTDKWLQNRYPCQCESVGISNVYLPEHSNEVLKERLKRIRNYKDCKELTLGTIANVDVRYKGQEYVIKAVSILNKNGYNLKYELVGGGDPMFLKRLAKKYNVENDVIFKGQMLHSDIIKWLGGIDIYVQPSKQEGLPRSVIEAMSRGVPCIGSTTAGIPELLDSRFIFQKINARSIARMIGGLNVDELLVAAEQNFVNSKRFEVSLLDKKRAEYFKKYERAVLNKCRDVTE